MDLKRIVPPFVAGLGLVVPAMAVAAGEVLDSKPPAEQSAAPAPVLTPANVSPTAALTATVGPDGVVFDASESSDPDGRIVSYEWDLDGDGTFELNTQAEATTRTTYAAGTTVAPAVRVTDDAGAGGQTTTDVTVPAAEPDPEPTAAAEPPKADQTEAEQPAPDREPAEPQPAAATPAAPEPEPRAADVRPAAKEEPTIVAAANGSVTIKDFEFGPASVTVNVGDSVTWVNQGPTVHTATAGGGEFDSGNLQDGQSFSHKFDKAGTYSYICTPHPFMTGRVTVTAASGGGDGDGAAGAGNSGGSGGGGNDSGTDAAGTTDDTTSTGGLPDTGADVFSWMALGFAMIAFGGALRWRLGTE